MILIGYLVRELREARALSRLQVERLCGVRRERLWYIEKQLTTPGIPTLERLAASFGVGVGRLLSKTEHEMLLEDGFIQKIHPLVRHLNENHKAAILKTLQAAPRQKARGME